MKADPMLEAIVRHLDAARAEAAEFIAAGCVGLGRLRQADAAYLERLLARRVADAGRGYALRASLEPR